MLLKNVFSDIRHIFKNIYPVSALYNSKVARTSWSSWNLLKLTQTCMRFKALENLSVIVIIIVQCLDLGKSVNKSKATWDQDLCGIGFNISLSAGKCLGTLAWAQTAQHIMNSLASLFIDSQLYLLQISSTALRMLGCPEVGAVWAHVMSLEWSHGGTHYLSLGHLCRCMKR